MTQIVADISVTPDFNGLPASHYHGLVHLTNNAAAILTLVAGLDLTVSLIGLVIASFTRILPNVRLRKAEGGKRLGPPPFTTPRVPIAVRT